jgi:hypothetical protein
MDQWFHQNQKKVIRLKGCRRINKYGWNKTKLFLFITGIKWGRNERKNNVQVRRHIG